MNDEVFGAAFQSGDAEQGTRQEPAGELKRKLGAPTWGQKSVLLVDANARSRDSRAKMLRKLGAMVECVSSRETAMLRFGSGIYNMVLIDPRSDIESAEQLANEIRTSRPQQLVAFLVGSPLFVAKSLKRDRAVLKRVPAAANITSEEKTKPPAADLFDFGQKIRDAEAKVVA